MKHSKQMPGKSHEASIEIAEGLPIGGVHPSHTKVTVPKTAPMNTKTQKRAHGFNERSQNGNAEKMGGC